MKTEITFCLPIHTFLNFILLNSYEKYVNIYVNRRQYLQHFYKLYLLLKRNFYTFIIYLFKTSEQILIEIGLWKKLVLYVLNKSISWLQSK